MKAENGLYLGPLRLLAAEVYETLTSEGIYTNLFTGQERREIAFSTHASATVEMANTNEEYDVVVIDEIQMISDSTRGAAWTKALMSLRCKEIHVCGGLEAKAIVQKIAKACGDDFELHKYKRFAPLKVSDRSLSNDPNEVGCYKKVSFLLVPSVACQVHKDRGFNNYWICGLLSHTSMMIRSTSGSTWGLRGCL
jgi:ATP-dependent RNA helicase SUPV3L1/SUV3